MGTQKVLIVTSEFPPLPGGIGNHAFNLGVKLHANSKEVTIITDQREFSSKESGFDEKQPFKIYRTPLKKVRVLMYFIRIFQTIQFTLKNDVIIASGKFPLWIVGIISIFINKKYLAVVHGTEVNSPSSFLKSFTNYNLQKIGNIIPVSNYTKSFIDHLKFKSIEVIPNGFSIEDRQFKKQNFKSTPNLVTVGRVSERKGQINVIEALPIILEKYPKACYHIVGISQDKDKLVERAKELKVLSHIVFYGKTDYEELYSVVDASDIFLMLSQNDDQGDIEGFGIAILEANSFGIPAIGSKGCGIEDAINHGESGVLVNPKNNIEVAAAVENILENKTSFQEKAKLWARRFEWNIIVKEYLKRIEG